MHSAHMQDEEQEGEPSFIHSASFQPDPPQGTYERARTQDPMKPYFGGSPSEKYQGSETYQSPMHTTSFPSGSTPSKPRYPGRGDSRKQTDFDSRRPAQKPWDFEKQG